jgi:hypothetical protein
VAKQRLVRTAAGRLAQNVEIARARDEREDQATPDGFGIRETC